MIRNFIFEMDVCFSGIIQLGLFRWNGEPSTWESSWHSGAYVRFADIPFALIFKSTDRSWSCFQAVLFAIFVRPDVLIIFVPGSTVFKICPMWLYYTYYICSRLHCLLYMSWLYLFQAILWAHSGRGSQWQWGIKRSGSHRLHNLYLERYQVQL